MGDLGADVDTARINPGFTWLIGDLPPIIWHNVSIWVTTNVLCSLL